MEINFAISGTRWLSGGFSRVKSRLLASKRVETDGIGANGHV